MNVLKVLLVPGGNGAAFDWSELPKALFASLCSDTNSSRLLEKSTPTVLLISHPFDFILQTATFSIP